MTDKNWILETVQRVTSEVFEGRVAELRNELVRRTVEEIHPSLSRVGSNGADASAKLLGAVVTVQTGEGPREILQKLLDQSANFCARSALFIVNEESVAGWQGIGFPDNEALPDFALDQDAALFQKVLTTQSSAAGEVSQMDTRFFETFGAPHNGQCHLTPILRKDKVAAVLYADAGSSDASCAGSALDVLVRFTSLWLEVRASRTFAAASPSAVENTSNAVAAPVAAPAVHASPVASPTWPETTAAPQIQAQAAAAPAAQVPAQAAFAAAANGPASAAPAAAPSPTPMSPEDADLHRKAQRFAKLLIDEIRLYNKAKVEEGRKNRDIYDRLRDDIDKSRASYLKRYGNTAAASADYFTHELLRGLAQEDATLLGPNFQR